MPIHLRKDLNSCLQYYFQESQPNPHNALTDAKCVKRICQRYSQTLGYESFADFLQDMFDRQDHRFFTKSFDEFDYRPPHR